MTTQSNIYVDQGTDTEYTTIINIINNEDFNLDDWEFIAAASKLYSSSIAIIPEIIKIPATEEYSANSIKMYISADQTKDLQPGKYVYDVVMKNLSTGETKKILEGLIFILQSIATNLIN